MQSPLLSAALQDRLAAGSYHCNYTYEDLLFIQVCGDPTPVHCNTVEGKMQSPLLSAALQDSLAAGSYHCNYTYEDLLFTQVCSDSPPVLQCTGVGKMHLPLLSAALQKKITAGLCGITLTKICCSYRCAVTQHQCTALLFFAKCNAHSSVPICKTGLQQACMTGGFTFGAMFWRLQDKL